jgi:hypothetical protein
MTGQSVASIPLTWYGTVLATAVLLSALATWLPALAVLAKGDTASLHLA